ncbi:MAG: hypothetical protein HY298_08485 [Verrucomicrobia bacterium]|nr:hypothetical protein [Verrucomicrobiota bacterium]
MKTSPITFFSFAVAMFLVCGATDLHAQGTAFTYQGRLTDNGSPANGSYDLRFYLRDAATFGNPVGTTNTVAPVAVSNGLFTVALDFGAGIFTGPARWLEIGIRTNGSVASYATLSTRQALTPAPYAIFANSSSNVVNGSVVKSLNTLKDDVALAAGANVTITPSGNTLTIASTGGGGSGPWLLNGSSAYYNGGRVGIGTTTPAAALEVNDPNGNALLYVTAPRPNLIFRDTIAGNARGVIGGFDGGLRFYTESWETGANPSAYMAFTTNGNLGIGTITPLSALHISGVADAVRLTGSKPFLTLEDTSAGLYSRIQSDGGGMNFKTQGAVTGSNPGGLIHLDGVGNVGIGTTTPNHHLSILNYAGGPTWTANGWIGAVELDNAAAIGWRSNGGGQRFGMGHSGGGFYLFRTASDPGTTGGAAVYDVVVNDSGNVGIGTTTPTSKLEIAAQDGMKITGFQPFLTLRDSNAGNARGVIQTVSGGLLFFTESYLSGANLNNSMALANSGNFSVKNITIRGGADVAEPFEFTSEHIPAGAVVIIDDEHPGKLKLTSHAYDTRVAGIVSGANGVSPGISLHQEGILEGGQNVALSGRVYVLADASRGRIKAGDLLTTSDTPGYAMKAVDHAKAQGAILGKAMSGLKDGKGMVLTLVTLQ